MKSLSCIALVFGLLATQGFAAEPVNAKSGTGAQGTSGDSPSGGSGNGGGRGFGSSPSGSGTVGGRGEGSGSGTPTGLERGGPSGPSPASGSNRDKESDRAFGGNFGGPLGSGSSWDNRPHNAWFYGPSRNSHGGRFFGSQGTFAERSNSEDVEGRFRQPGGSSGLSGLRGQGRSGFLIDNGPSGFGSRYQGWFDSQGGQGGSNGFGGFFGGDSFGGTSGFDSIFGEFEGHRSRGNPSGNQNFGGFSGQGGQGGMTDTNSFGRGLLDAMSGLSNLRSAEGDSEGLGQVFGSRRSGGFRQRLLAFLPPRSRSLARQYLIYRQNGGRGGFIHFLRQRRLGTLSSFGGAQTGSLRGTFGSSSQGPSNNFGQEQFVYWPRKWSEGSYGSSFGSSAGFTGEFGGVEDSFSQQSL